MVAFKGDMVFWEVAAWWQQWLGSFGVCCYVSCGLRLGFRPCFDTMFVEIKKKYIGLINPNTHHCYLYIVI